LWVVSSFEWIARMNLILFRPRSNYLVGSRQFGITFRRFVNGANKQQIILNSKIRSNLAAKLCAANWIATGFLSFETILLVYQPIPQSH
jgi:hypothetical protein